MGLYAMTRRYLGPNLMQVMKLSKVTNKAYMPFKKEETEKQPSVQRFKGDFCKIYRSSSPVEGLCIPVKSFAETAMTHKMNANFFCERKKGYNEPIARYPGYPGMNMKPLAPFVGNWRWYAKTQKPPEEKSVKESGGGVGRLDAASEGGFFHKMNKSRLEQIKKMLREKSKSQATPSAPPKE